MDKNLQPQPSPSSRFAGEWAIRQTKLIREGSWLGSISSIIPSYAQLR